MPWLLGVVLADHDWLGYGDCKDVDGKRPAKAYAYHITALACANMCLEVGEACEAWSFQIEDSNPQCAIYGQQIKDNLAGTAAECSTMVSNRWCDWSYYSGQKGAASITATDGDKGYVCHSLKDKGASQLAHALAITPTMTARDGPACACAPTASSAPHGPGQFFILHLLLFLAPRRFHLSPFAPLHWCVQFPPTHRFAARALCFPLPWQRTSIRLSLEHPLRH